MMRTTTYRIACAALLLALGTAACGAGKPVSKATLTEAPLTLWEIEKVCRQGTIAEAAAYDPKAAGVHPIALFERSGTDTNEYSSMTNTLLKLPEPWVVDYQGDPAAVQLVVCVTRTGSEFFETCEFSDDKEPDKTYLLDVYSATYEVRVVAAADGKEIAAGTLEASEDTCPMFHMFSGDAEKEESYAAVDGADLQAFLAEYVQTK